MRVRHELQHLLVLHPGHQRLDPDHRHVRQLHGHLRQAQAVHESFSVPVW